MWAPHMDLTINHSKKVTPLCFLWQNNASKLLLAIMESRHDSETAERILYNMRPKELVCMSRVRVLRWALSWCCLTGCVLAGGGDQKGLHAG